MQERYEVEGEKPLIEDERIQRNHDVLREYWIEELDRTLKEIKRQVKSFYSGFVGFFVNPIAGIVYDFFLAPEIREKTINTIDIYLEAARQDIGPTKIIEQYFENFKVNDISYIRCKHNHEKFSEILQRIKKSLVIRVVNARPLLFAQGDCYADLVRDAFKKEEVARSELIKQLEHLEDNLNFAIDNNLLKINSLISNQTLHILKHELEFKRAEFEKELHNIFDGCSL